MMFQSQTEQSSTVSSQDAVENALPTPSPWKFIDGTKEASMQYRPVHVIRSGDKQVASFSWNNNSPWFPTQGESEANAELIVKAVNGRQALLSRIARLEADLLECREYFETEVDVIDGDYGVPAPNRAMTLVSLIDETLNGAG